jgi:UDP-N-acetylmuramoyl-L-alanyl-D-glutamate--2,6-diaminopimelate ligase
MQIQTVKLIESIQYLSVVGNLPATISGIETDSRKISQGFVFVAIQGVAVDGHIFIEKAIEQGASVIVCQHVPQKIIDSVAYVVVENSAVACGYILRAYYEIDFSLFTVVGVTGTNGKTTTATLLYQVFEALGYKAGLISTVRNYIHTQAIESTHTTPDTVQLYSLFNAMIEQGCTHCFMEVSSHAIHQHRIAGIDFTGGIFTNLTQDHLDYHKTFAEYLLVKKSFFDGLPMAAFVLSNVDDKNGEIMLQNTKAHKYTYSLKGFSDFKCKILESHFDGMLLTIDGTEVWTKFIGAFNAYNILSVYAAAILLGQPKQSVLQIISTLNPVDGRIQFFRNSSGTTAVVDYAHTPDALENILTSLKKLCGTNNKIITVVGAGGNRDTSKRPIMGKIAAQLSDTLIITSDNPRNEEPQTIAQQMYDGVPETLRSKVITIIDRKEAIKTAVHIAKSTDVILVAGKGHETYQEIQGVKHHFDDREIIKELFKL